MNIGILFGGKSFEHSISIITAYQLKKKLQDYHNIFMIYFDINGNVYDCSKLTFKEFKENKKGFKKLNLSKMKLDLIVGAMHGENGEDGLAYNFARINNLPYFGSKGFGSSISLDKYKTYQFLSKNGIDMIDTYLYTYQDYLNGKIIRNYPIIIKTLNGGSSIGVFVIHNEEEFINQISDIFRYGKKVVVQPYYKDIIEYNLALTETDYSNLERINSKDEIFTFENKYTDSFKLLHQQINTDILCEEFKTIARRVYNLLDLNGIVRIDFFVIDNHIFVNEINTTPGALSIGLFNDFISIFNKSLKILLTEEKIEYICNDILSGINK